MDEQKLYKQFKTLCYLLKKGGKIQLEFDKKNNEIRLFEITTKKLKI